MSASTVTALALVFSHLAAIPALILLGYKKLVVDVVVLGTAVLISTLYHLCQVEWACFGLDVHALQIADHFMVFFALVWFLLYAAGASERIRTAVTIAIMGVSLPIIISKLDTWIAGGIVIGLGVLAFVITFFAYAKSRGYYNIEWHMFFLALALIGGGVVLHIYAGDFGPDNTAYPVAHTVWHVLAFVSLYYIVWIPHVDASPFNLDRRRRFVQQVRTPGRTQAKHAVGGVAVAVDARVAPRAPPPPHRSPPDHHLSQTGVGTYLTFDS